MLISLCHISSKIFVACLTALFVLIFVQVYVYSFGKTMKFAATYHRDWDIVSKDCFRWCCCLRNWCATVKLHLSSRNETASEKLSTPLENGDVNIRNHNILLCF